MRHLLLIKNNLKRSVVTAITLIFLVGVAMCTILVSMNSLLQTENTIEAVRERTNAADIEILMPRVTHEKPVDDILSQIETIRETEREDVLFFQDGSIKNREKNNSGDELPIIIQKGSHDRKLSRLNTVEESSKKHSNGIYLPYYLGVAKDYKLGDKVSFYLSGKECKGIVDGFYQDIFFANPSNYAAYLIYVTDEMWENISENANNVNEFYFWRVISEGEASTDDLDTEFTKKFNEKYEIGLESGSVLSYDSMKTGMTMFPSIVIGIILGLAGVLLIIAIVVIRFQIITYIQQNYKNIGVMEATGYTSKDLILVFVGMFILISLVGIGLGEGVSILGGHWVNLLLGMITGIKWAILPNVTLYTLAAVFMVAFVALVSVFASLKIRKITVLNALRDGINTHNFKKNHFSLEKTPLPLNLTIGLKGIMASLRQNVSIVFIICLLSFSVTFSFTLSENFDAESNAIWTFIGMERGDIHYSYKSEDIKNEVSKNEDIAQILEQGEIDTTISSKEKEQTLETKVSPDFDKYSKDVIVEGRFPKADNEISLTTLIAKKLEVGINDVVTVLCGDKKEEYIVVGITQQTSNLGRSSALTYDGAKKVVPNLKINTGIYTLKEGVDINKFINSIYEKYGNKEVVFSNLQKLMNDMMTMFSIPIMLLCVGMLALTVIVVTLVLYLLVSVKVLKEKRNYGVAKAMGYTTGQLFVQIISGFMPQIIIGCTLGATLAVFGTNPLIALCMASVGFKKCSFTIPVVPIVLIVIAVVLLAFIITMSTAVRIRKITPAQLVEQS